jgi:dihydropteroate synthase
MSSNALAIDVARGALELRGRRFVWGARTYLMGIVNVTPDSFSGDGLPDAPEAIEHAMRLHADADIIDIGAESTRPGHTPIDGEEELRRLVPVVRGLRARAPEAVISIDTFKPAVFAAAHAAGGDMLNSIWGFDDELLAAAVETGVPIVIMHNKRPALSGGSGGVASRIYQGDPVDDVLAYLEHQAARALRAGIGRERIILDPGIGFGKTPEDNLALLRSLPRIVALGFPTLLGTSRKSTIGKLTGRAVGERAYGTAATVALAVAAGIDIVRVHDVAAMRDAARVSDAIVRGWRPDGWGTT